MYLSLHTIKEILLKKGNFRIVFLGDSCTSTEWVHPNWREIVEYVLKMELDNIMNDWKVPSWGIRCFNAGFDGAGTLDLLKRLEQDVLSFDPEMIVYIDSSNDHHFKIGPEQHAEYDRQLLERIKARVPYVVFTTSLATNSQAYNQEYALYVEKLKEILPLDGIESVNLFEEYQKYDLPKFFTLKNKFGTPALKIEPGQADYAHPNQLGNAYVAKIILEQAWGVQFDADKYIEEIKNGEMFPGY